MHLSLRSVRRLACPRCGDLLRASDRGGVEIDLCPGCHGAWFDQLEIEAFLHANRDLPNYVPEPLRRWAASALPCPVCRKPMKTLVKNPVFPFDVEMCPEDKGYWADGEELDRLRATVARKTMRVRPVDTTPAAEMAERIARREVERVEERHISRQHPAEGAVALEDASFFDLSGGQRVLAFLGLPAESDCLYAWRSWMNLLIILATSAVFVLMLLKAGVLSGLAGHFPKEWYRALGFVPSRFAADPQGAAYTLITSMFIHGGIVHLLGNMFFLFTTGDDIEERIGPFPFLGFYILAGIVAGLVSAVAGSASSVPHVGASGAIAGVMGAYMVLCRHKSFYVWLVRATIFGKMISVSAWMYLLFWFAGQLISLKFGNPGIDYWAHIGGFVFGVAMGIAVRQIQCFNGFTGKWEWRWKKR